jgi:tetratricopeptide (TPR) repeat protein
MFLNAIAPGFSLDAFLKIERTKTFQNNSIEELFVLLNQAPYHPRLCFELGEKMEKDSLPRNAQLFWICGSVCPALSSKYAEKCRRKLPSKSLFTFQDPISLDLNSFKEFSGKADFKGGLQPLNELSGRIPGGLAPAVDENYQAGMNEFQEGNLQDAYDHFCRSLAENISFDANNMGGNVARRINKPYEAIALLLQTAAIDPQSPYPWVNLALTFNILQKND